MVIAVLRGRELEYVARNSVERCAQSEVGECPVRQLIGCCGPDHPGDGIGHRGAKDGDVPAWLHLGLHAGCRGRDVDLDSVGASVESLGDEVGIGAAVRNAEVDNVGGAGGKCGAVGIDRDVCGGGDCLHQQRSYDSGATNDDAIAGFGDHDLGCPFDEQAVALDGDCCCGRQSTTESSQ